MYKELLEALESETTSLVTAVTERQTQRHELEKALKSTDNELLRLEGRLIEVKSIVKYIEGLETPASQEVETEEPSVEN